MNVMEVLSNHRLATAQMDQNFIFYKEMTQLLRKHQDFKNQGNDTKKEKQEDYISTIDQIANEFQEIFQKVINIKTSILDLQQAETLALKSKIQSFAKEITSYRQMFKDTAPFTFDIKGDSSMVTKAFG